MDWGTIGLSALSAIVGTALGAFLINHRAESKISGIRKMAIKALELFSKYANGNNTYINTQDDFNNEINISEKMAILVAIQKIGVPIAISSAKAFNIKKVEFLSEVIDKDVISSMIGQVKKGNCDHLFYADIEKHFSERQRENKIRDSAKRYVNTVMSKSYLSKTENGGLMRNLPFDWESDFTPGELTVLLTFQHKTNDNIYYLANNEIDKNKIQPLIEEIEIGLWDHFLQWDYTAYLNMLAQKTTHELLIQSYQNHQNAAPISK